MKAMAFPMHLEPALGRFRSMTEQEEIAQSVRMILTTRPGERPCRPEFGTNLDRFAFENMDTTTCNLIRQEVVASLQKWEKRIWMIEVQFDRQPDQGVLVVRVSYEICSSGVSDGTELTLQMQ